MGSSSSSEKQPTPAVGAFLGGDWHDNDVALGVDVITGTPIRDTPMRGRGLGLNLWRLCCALKAAEAMRCCSTKMGAAGTEQL